MKYKDAVELLNTIMVMHQKMRSDERESLSNIAEQETIERVLESLAPLEKCVIPTIQKMLEINDKGLRFEPISFYNLMYIIENQCYGTVIIATINGIELPKFSIKLLQPWED